MDRSARLELGASRVLTVTAPNSTALLAAVRAADPAGRYAMAVAYDPTFSILAVDTTRLAAVLPVPAAYHLLPAATLARRLRPIAPTALTLHDGTLSVTAAVTASVGPTPVSLAVVYTDASGLAHLNQFGPLSTARETYRSPVTGCAAGCRLVALEPVGAGVGTGVTVFGIDQAGPSSTEPVVADGALLGDVRRWRSQVGFDVVGPLVTADADQLEITITGASAAGDNRVYYDGAPIPVPVALAGPAPVSPRAGDDRVRVLGAISVPYTPVTQARLCPSPVPPAPSSISSTPRTRSDCPRRRSICRCGYAPTLRPASYAPCARPA